VIDWLIGWLIIYLTPSEQYFSYIQDENKFPYHNQITPTPFQREDTPIRRQGRTEQPCGFENLQPLTSIRIDFLNIWDTFYKRALLDIDVDEILYM